MTRLVQDTNDNCTVSKCSMVTQGYFEDEFIPLMVPKCKRRCPLINIGYYVRAKVVEEAITHFLEVTRNVDSQVLTLGAGFDTLYFRLISKFPRVSHFEVDLEDVVINKIKFIKNSCLIKKLNNIRDFPNQLLTDNYSLIALDMSNVQHLEKVLMISGMVMNKPTLILSECAITYLEEKKSRSIISWSSNFPNVAFIIYEQIYPDDGFSQAMLKHYDNMGLPLWSIEVYRTKEDQINRFKSCGYEWSWSAGAFELYKAILSSEEHLAVINKEPFDEWEEWHLTSAHYTLSVGTKGFLNQTFLKFASPYGLEINTAAPLELCKWEVQKSVPLQFFGHTALEIWEGSAILVIGGFGLSMDNKHKRLHQLCLINVNDFEVKYISPPNITGINWDCMHHTCSILSDSINDTEFLLFGGRLSPLKSSNNPPFKLRISRNENDDVLVSGGQILTNGLQPCHRRRHSSTKLTDSTFIFGGITTDHSVKQKVLGDAWILTKEETWIPLESKPSPRFSHSAAYHDGALYIIGGLGGQSLKYGTLNDIWTYIIADKVWMQLEINLIPRYSHTCHVIGNNLMLIGGVNELSEKQPGLAVVNISSSKVNEFKLPGSTRDLPIMIHNHSSISLPQRGGILVIGGGGHCFSFGTYFNKHPVIIKLPSCFNCDV